MSLVCLQRDSTAGNLIQSPRTSVWAPGVGSTYFSEWRVEKNHRVSTKGCGCLYNWPQGANGAICESGEGKSLGKPSAYEGLIWPERYAGWVAGRSGEVGADAYLSQGFGAQMGWSIQCSSEDFWGSVDVPQRTQGGCSTWTAWSLSLQKNEQWMSLLNGRECWAKQWASSCSAAWGHEGWVFGRGSVCPWLNAWAAEKVYRGIDTFFASSCRLQGWNLSVSNT